MDSTRKFDGRATDYTAGRPSYSAELLETLYSRFGFSEESVIADIGSGTGIFAGQLLERGSSVICVEPNDDMRNAAERELAGYPNFRSVKGTAAMTNLSADSVDFITAAQAFHWFDVTEFKKECRRILRGNGKVVLVWNMRDMDDEVNKKSFDLYRNYCPEFKGFCGGLQAGDRRIREFFYGNYDVLEFEYPLYFDRDKFIRRSLSGSYSLQRGDRNFEAYMTKLNDLFDLHAIADVLKTANKTIAYIGTVN